MFPSQHFRHALASQRLTELTCLVTSWLLGRSARSELLQALMAIPSDKQTEFRSRFPAMGNSARAVLFSEPRCDLLDESCSAASRNSPVRAIRLPPNSSRLPRTRQAWDSRSSRTQPSQWPQFECQRKKKLDLRVRPPS